MDLIERVTAVGEFLLELEQQRRLRLLAQRWLAAHDDYDNGRNDGFVLANTGANDPQGNDPSGYRAMGYFDDREIPFYYQLASTFATSRGR